MAALDHSVITVALGRTRKSIYLRDVAGAKVATLGIADVQGYLDRGYEAHGTKHRVRYLCPARPKLIVRPELPFRECWLNSAAAVIRFHGEQLSA